MLMMRSLFFAMFHSCFKLGLTGAAGIGIGIGLGIDRIGIDSIWIDEESPSQFWIAQRIYVTSER